MKKIILSDSQRTIIKTIKLHHKDKLKPNSKTWFKSLSLLYEEIYGYKFKNDNRCKSVMFNSLLNIYFLIQYDQSGDNRQLKELFHVSFWKSVSRNHNKPIDRVIDELCGLIQCNTVQDRYNLK